MAQGDQEGISEDVTYGLRPEGCGEYRRERGGFLGRRNSMCKEFRVEKDLGRLRKAEDDKVPGALQVKERVA